MPIYKGSTEITSGNLYKGSTKIENGYKQASSFYVNTNSIIINFVDNISGASMSTTQFSQTGTPGSAFTSFTRAITVDSGRVFSGTVSVSEVGDSGGNVSASISGQTSTAATLNVSGTFPATGTTITLNVNGSTVADLPNLNVSVNNYGSQVSGSVSTENGGALGAYTWTASSNCSNGTSDSGSGNTSSSSANIYTSANTGSYPACGSSCSYSINVSASGYDSGGGGATVVGSPPTLIPSCTNGYFNYGYNFLHNPARPTGNPDGCQTIQLNSPPSNFTSLGVIASNCAGSWPSSWSDAIGATLSYTRCTGATGTTTGNLTCTGGGNSIGTVDVSSAQGSLYNT